jgi:hypothetical protein
MMFFFSPAFFTFSPQNALFRHIQFFTLIFSMKVAESRKIFLVVWIIDFQDKQVWYRWFSLNLNAYKIIMELFEIWRQFWPDKIKRKSRGPSKIKRTIWQNQEDHHNFVGIEIQAKQSYPNLFILKIDKGSSWAKTVGSTTGDEFLIINTGRGGGVRECRAWERSRECDEWCRREPSCLV